MKFTKTKEKLTNFLCVNDCCLTPISNFSAISWREQVNHFLWYQQLF